MVESAPIEKSLALKVSHYAKKITSIQHSTSNSLILIIMYVFSMIFKQSEVYFFAWLVGDQRGKERGFFAFALAVLKGS